MTTASLKGFQELNSRQFKVALADNHTMPLELDEISVNDLAPAGYESFSLYFHGDSQTVLEQGMYCMHHAEMGECTIFISPKDVNDTKAIYEAVFNQKKEG